MTTTTTIWRVRLVHTELGARVVEASCEEGGQVLAMALGEATTAEVAEDRARRRAAQLLDRHRAPAAPSSETPRASEKAESIEADQPGAPRASTPDPQSSPPPPPATAATPAPPPDGLEPEAGGSPGPGQPTVSPATAPPEPQPSPSHHGAAEPADWSEDLAVVELQLEQLGWDREQESVYLERCFGHMERSSITRYQDLRLYIDALQALSPPADPCTAPLPGQPQQPPPPPPLPSRELLLRNGNTLLRRLGWTTQQGRAFLKRHFGHTSRQALRDAQLMQFNQQLEALLATGGGDDSPAS